MSRILFLLLQYKLLVHARPLDPRQQQGAKGSLRQVRRVGRTRSHPIGVHRQFFAILPVHKHITINTLEIENQGWEISIADGSNTQITLQPITENPNRHVINGCSIDHIQGNTLRAKMLSVHPKCQLPTWIIAYFIALTPRGPGTGKTALIQREQRQRVLIGADNSAQQTNFVLNSKHICTLNALWTAYSTVQLRLGNGHSLVHTCQSAELTKQFIGCRLK